jgi:hypothetical protein
VFEQRIVSNIDYAKQLFGGAFYLICFGIVIPYIVIKSKKGNLLLVKPDKSSGSVPRQKFSAKKEAKRKLPKTERPKKEIKTLGLKVPERETPTMQEESGFTPYYLLKKSVTQKPWPNSIPTEKQIADVFNEAALYWVKTIGERKAA